jgi:hypothetical protein
MPGFNPKELALVQDLIALALGVGGIFLMAAYAMLCARI